MSKRKKPEEPKPRLVFTQTMADLICNYIATGGSLRQFCDIEGMPSRTTIYKWLSENKAFADQYARAREDQAETYAQEIVMIADTEADPARARVRIDARKWVASKLLPKVYGDKVVTELQGGDKPVEIISTTTDELLTEINRLATRAGANGASKKSH